VEELRIDLHWTMENINYVIRNVPYEMLDVEDEEVINLDVAIKLELIRELMYTNQIPHDVDFDKVSDLELEY
jgi:hypothetical protein